MCIAISAVILSISGTRARADCMGNIIDIELGLVDAQVGERVLVHAGCAIQKLTEEQARENDAVLRDIMEAWNED